jgi:hypothetical protein
MKDVWLICKEEGKASAHKLAEQDVEGYVNSIRNTGVEEFEIATPEYGINNQGRFEIDIDHVLPEYGTYAAHQPGYENFKERGVLDDYIYQSLVHMGHSSHQLSWALTVLDHVDVPKELREEIRQVLTAIPKLQERLRTYSQLK